MVGVKRVLVEYLFVHFVNKVPNVLQVRRSPMKLSKMDKWETKGKCKGKSSDETKCGPPSKPYSYSSSSAGRHPSCMTLDGHLCLRKKRWGEIIMASAVLFIIRVLLRYDMSSQK